jgi:hypothetical protein
MVGEEFGVQTFYLGEEKFQASSFNFTAGVDVRRL